MVKHAFTLIELIFAIVVIGIAVISIPTMNQSTTRGIEGNLVQEAIFAASTELNQAVTANWDDNSLEPGATDSLARVIQLYNGVGKCDDVTRLMAGHVSRRCLDDNTTTRATVNVAAVTSLEDMNKTASALTNATVNEKGYKFSWQTTIQVTPNAIFGGAANSSMKAITATVTGGDDYNVSLTTYSANIGEVDYHSRTF